MTWPHITNTIRGEISSHPSNRNDCSHLIRTKLLSFEQKSPIIFLFNKTLPFFTRNTFNLFTENHRLWINKNSIFICNQNLALADTAQTTENLLGLAWRLNSCFSTYINWSLSLSPPPLSLSLSLSRQNDSKDICDDNIIIFIFILPWYYLLLWFYIYNDRFLTMILHVLIIMVW